MMDEAEHALAFGSGGLVSGLIGLRAAFDLGAREMAMLYAVAEAAAGEDQPRVFEYLCSRAFDGGSRTGLAVTPPELAELMLDLAGDKTVASWTPRAERHYPARRRRRGYTRVEGQEQDG